MTEKRRKEIALEYRRELDRRAGKQERKNWVPEWLREKKIGIATLYRWCRKHGVPTR